MKRKKKHKSGVWVAWHETMVLPKKIKFIQLTQCTASSAPRDVHHAHASCVYKYNTNIYCQFKLIFVFIRRRAKWQWRLKCDGRDKARAGGISRWQLHVPRTNPINIFTLKYVCDRDCPLPCMHRTGIFEQNFELYTTPFQIKIKFKCHSKLWTIKW